MRLPAEAIARHFSLKLGENGDWVETPGLLLAVHPSKNCVAVAYQNELAVFGIHNTTSDQHSDRQPAHTCTCVTEDTITAVKWLAFSQKLTPTASMASGSLSGNSQQSVLLRRTGSASNHRKVVASIRDLLDDEGPGTSEPQGAFSHVCLLLGTSTGYVQVHSSGGTPLLRQRLHTSAVRHIHVRTWQMGLKSDELLEDITVTFMDVIVRLSPWEVRMLIRSVQASASDSSSMDSSLASTATVHVQPLSVQTWDLPWGVKGRQDATCYGYRPPDLYSLMQASGPSQKPQKLVILTGGEHPALAAIEADESSQRNALSIITGIASSLSTGVLNLASNTGSYVMSRPRAIGTGLKNWVLGPLYGSRALPKEQPLATYDDLQRAPKPSPTTLWRCFRDSSRVVTELVPAPFGTLLAATDNLGRVLLVDGSTCTVLRMWKGYRNAECGWLLIPQQRVEEALQNLTPHASPQRQPLPHQTQNQQSQASPQQPIVLDLSGAAAQHGQPLRRHHATGMRQQSAAGPPPSPQQPQDGMQNNSSSPSLPGEESPFKLSQEAAHSRPSASGGAGHGSQCTNASSVTLVLALYAPRRSTLELWLPLHGQCLHRSTLSSKCKLCYWPGACGSWHPGSVSSREDLVRNAGGTTILLQAVDGKITDLVNLL